MKTGKIVWKQVILLLAGVVMLCGLISLAYFMLMGPFRTAVRAQLWEKDPVQATETARALIDFDLPPGYQPEKVLKLGVDAVIIVSQVHSFDLIYISQAPDGILADDEWRTVYEERGAHEIADQLYDTQTISTQTAIVRGQPTTLRLLEGIDKNGRAVKQLACMFAGKSVDILLVMVASQATWDQSMVDNFLNTIR